MLLEVDGDIPYLNQDEAGQDLAGTDTGDIDTALKAAGLRQWHGKLALDIDYEVPIGGDDGSAIALPAKIPSGKGGKSHKRQTTSIEDLAPFPPPSGEGHSVDNDDIDRVHPEARSSSDPLREVGVASSGEPPAS